MHFEKNNIVPDSPDDEEILIKGKKNKKVKEYGIFIYKILLEESSEDSPFKVKDLCLRIVERFHTYMDISTIQDYIGELKLSLLDDCTLEGNAYDGYYLVDNSGYVMLPPEFVLDDIEINIIVQSIRNSRLASSGSKKEIMKKLMYFASENLRTFVRKNHYIPKDENFNFLGNLFSEDMIEIINECRPMMIKMRKSRIAKEQNEYREFYLYAIENCNLIGKYKDSKIAICISFSMIDDYYVLSDEKFEKKPLNIRCGFFFPEERIKLLKEYYPNDFIFPSDYEISLHRQKLANARAEEKKKQLAEIEKRRSHTKEGK